MNWTEMLSKIFEIVLIPLIGILTAYLVQFLKTKSNQLISEQENELAKKYLSMLNDTVANCVMTTSQTYVDSLKAQGKFDKEAQSIAFQMTYQTILNTLSDEVKNYLEESVNDLELFLINKIEAEVRKNKVA